MVFQRELGDSSFENQEHQGNYVRVYLEIGLIVRTRPLGLQKYKKSSTRKQWRERLSDKIKENPGKAYIASYLRKASIRPCQKIAPEFKSHEASTSYGNTFLDAEGYFE